MGYNNRLSGYLGENKTLFFSAYDSSNNTMDLTGYTGTLYLKSVLPGSSLALSVNGVMDSSALSFTFDFVLDPSIFNAGDYISQVDISSNTKKKTPLQDKFSVFQSLSVED